MLKRTKGYFLLIMLVLTGLAGRLHTDTLSGKERRFLINYIKETRSALLQKVENLDKRQIDFRPSHTQWSIKQYIFYMASMEQSCWEAAKNALHETTLPSEYKLSDHDIELMPLRIEESLNKGYTSFTEAQDALKKAMSQMLTYARTSTENPRQHILRFSESNIDVYQLLLLACEQTRQCIRKIDQIKKFRAFPN